jgi:hypothetical protein
MAKTTKLASGAKASKAAASKAAPDEILVKDIIKRYGDTIDLKKNPHLIIEILRTHGKGFAEVPDGGVSVAGVGSPPGPAKIGTSLGNVVDNAQIMKEILRLSKQVNTLTEQLQKTKK